MRRVKKSRNGCARCKSKRVKCGEEKPHCNRCTRLGVHCPGYAQSLRWVNQPKHPSPTASAASLATSTSSSTKQPSHPIEDELASFSYMGTSELGLDNPPAFDNLWFLPIHDNLARLTDSPPTSHFGLLNNQTYVNDFEPGNRDPNTEQDIPSLHSSIGSFEENHGSIYRHFSPSTVVRSYSPPGQRISPPAGFIPMSQPLNNSSWTLIEYYFKEVAALFSSYDSQMNPFRTTVSRLWGSSQAMFLTMQSMAAASLVKEFPQFGPIGRNLRHQAIGIISSETVMDDKTLLATLMLGQTASWHNTKDLGIPFFNLLRKQLNTNSAPKSPGTGIVESSSNNHRFFDEALVYWEMLLSFVADNDKMATAHPNVSSCDPLALQRVPHPWTGIAKDTQFTVHEIGKLVRCERRRIRARKFTSRNEINRAQLAIDKAHELEERLLALAHPDEAEIVSPGDDDTPVWHHLTMAEVYRCTGLMQLYRVFPDLLRSRLSPNNANLNTTTPLASLSPFFHDLDGMSVPTGLDDQTPGNISSKNTFPTQKASSQSLIPSPDGEIISPSSQHPPYQASTSMPLSEDYISDDLYDSWLTEFAVTTLARLKTIPFESRTRCLQPLLLVASCSELHLPLKTKTSAPCHRQNDEQLETGEDPTASTRKKPETETEPPNISMGEIEVSNTRKFILGRLTSLLHVLPPRPIQVCSNLVKEVWRRMDAGETDTFWVDVMIEKGWETTMG